MRISFDFDDCLNNNISILNLFNILRNTKNEIFILTQRNPIFKQEELWDFVKEQKFDKIKVILNPQDKWKTIKENNIDFHFDNDFIEIDLINRKLGSKNNKPGILVSADNTWLSYKHGNIS